MIQQNKKVEPMFLLWILVWLAAGAAFCTLFALFRFIARVDPTPIFLLSGGALVVVLILAILVIQKGKK